MSEHEEVLPRSDREWLAKLVKDTYVGNGKAGIIARLASVEKAIETITFYGRWILLLCAGILITAVVELVVKR